MIDVVITTDVEARVEVFSEAGQIKANARRARARIEASSLRARVIQMTDGEAVRLFAAISSRVSLHSG